MFLFFQLPKAYPQPYICVHIGIYNIDARGGDSDNNFIVIVKIVIFRITNAITIFGLIQYNYYFINIMVNNTNIMMNSKLSSIVDTLVYRFHYVIKFLNISYNLL